MQAIGPTGGRRWLNQRSLWNRKFSGRREIWDRSEGNRLTYQDQTLQQAFLTYEQDPVEPPHYNDRLASFLELAKEADLVIRPNQEGHAPGQALLDIRRVKKTGDKYASRNWERYHQDPYEGEDIETEVMDAPHLCARLSASVRRLVTTLDCSLS